MDGRIEETLSRIRAVRRRMLLVIRGLWLACMAPVVCLFSWAWEHTAMAGVSICSCALTLLLVMEPRAEGFVDETAANETCKADTLGWAAELASWYAVRPDVDAPDLKAQLAATLDAEPDDDTCAILLDLTRRMDGLTGERYTDGLEAMKAAYAADPRKRKRMLALYREVMAHIAADPTAEPAITTD